MRRYSLRVMPDDAVGAALVALVEAAGRFTAGAMPFDGYAFKRVAGAVKDLSNKESSSYRRRNGSTRFYPPTAVDLFAVAWRLGDGRPSALDVLADRQVVARILKRAMPREREVLTAVHVEGLSLAEVGARLGISESRACQLAKAGAARIRAAWR